MLPSLLPEKGKYKIHGGVKMKGTVKRDFKVLTEKISPENIAVMAELIAMRETKALIGFMGYHAEKAHKRLCRDIFGKHEPGYIFSDSYDLVQSVALFVCGHYGEYLDDTLYISKKGKPRTIKIECYLIITRMLARDHRALCKCQCLEFTKSEHLFSRTVWAQRFSAARLAGRSTTLFGVSDEVHRKVGRTSHLRRKITDLL